MTGFLIEKFNVELNKMNDLLEKNGNFLKIIIGTLVTIGIIMIYSASYMYSKEVHGSSLYYMWKQVIFALVSLVGAFIVSKSKYQFWFKNSIYLNGLVCGLLVLTFIPGLGVTAKGANRWLNFGGVTLQPGEFAKYTTMILSFYVFEFFEKMTMKERVKNISCLLLTFVLLINQPDFGTFFICSCAVMFACFLSNFPRKIFYSLLGGGTIIAIALMLSQPYRVKRLTTFLDPWANSKGSGFQIIQSWIGFANGGFFGKGVGNSLEKLFFLPEAHNDFIFSVVGEEFGFIGVVFLVSLFIAFIFMGFKVALMMKDRVSSLLTSGVVFIIGIQVVLNMGVVLGLLPTKGLNLPFISSGGSSLFANFIGIGLIFSCLNRQIESRSNLS